MDTSTDIPVLTAVQPEGEYTGNYIGFHFYPTIFNELSTSGKVYFCCQLLYVILQAIGVIVVVGLFWNEKTIGVQVIGIVYAFLLLLLLPCPLYFTLPQPTYDIPEIVDKERKRSRFRKRLDTMFLPLLVIISWIVFNSEQSRQLKEDNSPLFYASMVYTIIGYCYVLSPVFIAIVAILFLSCFMLNARMREEARIRSMGASEDLINSIPILKFRKPQLNEELGTATNSIAMIPQKKTKRFKLISWKKKTVAPEIEPQPDFITLNEEDAQCSICIAEYEEGEELRQLPCKHHFHMHCIDEWLKRNAKCPLCVASIVPSESK
jgi:hypothetical protein